MPESCYVQKVNFVLWCIKDVILKTDRAYGCSHAGAGSAVSALNKIFLAGKCLGFMNGNQLGPFNAINTM